MTTMRDRAQSLAGPMVGSMVLVRGQRWVVGAVDATGPGQQRVLDLQSIEDGRYGETLTVVWDVEVGAAVVDADALPTLDDLDPPASISAYLDAARWSTATSADVNHLQAPFRSGVTVEDYQLEPLARALTAPRVNLLLADDVGLGKTVEAGLVTQELLLRHRARSVLIVCPAGLTAKWRDEMAEKFGLDFVLIDAAECARLRRVRGSAANPFRIHSLMIVSLPWLRTPRAQRLLAEVLPSEVDPRRRTFDLLILDEAHHVAPAAPKQRYAVDSQQTKLIRRLAPHCEHRLFLSATPHNGYPESFTALLELIDDQRFARGVSPDPIAQRETVIRRLKRDITQGSGGATFLERHTRPLEVGYTQEERRAYSLLAQLNEARRQRVGKSKGRHRIDVVALLLKKRLYSSPAAFARTVDVVRESTIARSRIGAPSKDVVPNDEWAEDFLEDIEELDTLDDDERIEAEDAAIRRAQTEDIGGSGELDLLDQMLDWARPFDHQPDTKAKSLLRYLEAVCRPDGKLWNEQRVVVFTEYRDTQTWLEELLRQHGMTIGGRVALLHGGVAPDDRERLRQEFQASPADTPVRILIATDAAAEGIDLHWQCHRLVNYDIPFNPNRLEQRIGRIDRYGQRHTPEIRHFVGEGWQKQRTGFDGDTDFLYRIATKVAQVEADLGSVNAVLAVAVQRAMLGQRVDVDALDHPKARRLPSDTDVREQVARLRVQLDATVSDLGITPLRIRRLVDTALGLARQASLTKSIDPDELYDVPPLTGTWVRASQSLGHPLRPDGQRPITFDGLIARDRRDDVVYAHLNHPLVAMSTRLLSAAAAAGTVELSRATAVVGDHPELTEPMVVAFARFLVVGGDALRLHEEVVHAGGWLRAGQRFARIENLGLLTAIVEPALAAGILVPPALHRQLVDAWPRAESAVTAALEWRVRARREQIDQRLTRRRDDELARSRTNFERFAASLNQALAEPEAQMLPFEEAAEAAQAERDRLSWANRLAALDNERTDEAERISARYEAVQDLTFPLAVVVVVPRKLVIR